MAKLKGGTRVYGDFIADGKTGLGTANPTDTLTVSGNSILNGRTGINTSSVSASGLVGTGNTFQGLYVSNAMTIYDNTLNGNHYIGTNFNGLMAGPVTVNGIISIDGNFVVV